MTYEGVSHEHRGDPPSPPTFEQELEAVINRHSQENGSNTPDFILAQFLIGCLAAWNAAVTRRETWYGRDNRGPGGGSGPGPVPIDKE